ncbi:MAG: YesN/AraC family two-component response regulator [Sulfurimonas sp.]|jgi:YesN/AraC family two-component response regulator|uniref:response regulator transcription factor n=1 Tax=Sulfurimonas sp. TaxID=2022749 RepID=UPI0039E51222
MAKNIELNIGLLKEKAKKMSVLYVEDEESLRNKTQYMLNKLFQNVDLAVDGKDGLDKYFHNKYDIVITDILMPNMNGLELINSIRKNDPDQEIIIMSAYTESEYTDQINRANVTGYIYKPVNINQMLEVLNKSINKLKE